MESGGCAEYDAKKLANIFAHTLYFQTPSVY